MSEFDLSYIDEESKQQSLKIKSGEILFLLGSNGTGKSTLMHKFSTQNSGKIRRVTAHRQIWLDSDSINLTPVMRRQVEQNIINIDRQDHSRWKDDFASQRFQATIFDLIDYENLDARKIANAVRSGQMQDVDALAQQQSPIAKMNDILRMSNLQFQVIVDEESKLMASREGCKPYSIAELSDGERSALLIIANVLTAPNNTLILLDDPERHLHRSIISPLISTLLRYREDCAFVVSTHDVGLPHDQKHTGVLLLRKYLYESKAWIADYIDDLDEIDEEISLSILGSRRLILFIEGIKSSLDLQLYQILYPDVSIKPLQSCIDVERVVKGIRAVEKHHWIEVYGIIDRDNRSDEECAQLSKNGIIALEQYSVESLYYHPCVVAAIIKKMSTVHEIDVTLTIEKIQKDVLEVINQNKDRLAARLIERKVKDHAIRSCPDWKSILDRDVEVKFSTKEILEEEKKLILSLLSKKNLEKLISRYPLRETRAFEIIATNAHFQSQKHYEQAVRKMLIDDEKALDMVRELIAKATALLIINKATNL